MRPLIAVLALACAMPALAQTSDAPITEAELRADIAVLADDAMAGRKPGTAGETLAVHYIATQLHAAGFVGGAGGDLPWYQSVPLVEILPDHWSLGVAGGDGAAPIIGDLIIRALRGTADLPDAEALFVGHGVDGTGVVRADVRGRIALMLAADRAGDHPLSVSARRERLAAAGAIGVLLVAEPGAFLPLRRGLTRGNAQRVALFGDLVVDGALADETATALLAAGGVDLAAARAAAQAADYAGQALTERLTIRATAQTRRYDSYNVVARLPGHDAASGSVLLMGHWDHLGLCRPADAPDRICNGAVDNASGIALMLAAARRLGAGATLPRDVWVLATTAEESGLNGAAEFVARPPLSPASIVAVLNVDTVAVMPRGAPVAIIGRGTTQLDDDVAVVATALGRTMVTEDVAASLLRRQDGWVFTQAGLPAIMAGGAFADMAVLEAFLGEAYHGPDDELTDATELGGAAEDGDLTVALVRRLADPALVTLPPRN